MAFALAAVAGVFAGLALNVFAVALLVAPLFLSVLLVKAPGGLLGAFCTAAVMSGVLQLGYVAGLCIRSNRRQPRSVEIAVSSEIVKK